MHISPSPNRRPSLRLGLLTFSVLVLAGSVAFTGGGKGGPEYQRVADWPQWPEGVARHPVSAVATDSADNVYVLQRAKPYVVVFDRQGKWLRSWDGDFKTPHGLRLDKDDNVWVADMANHLVQKFTSAGKLLLSLGKKDQAGTALDQFNKPADVAVGREGELYVADGYGNSRIVKLSKEGKPLKTWGERGKKEGEFNLPHVAFVSHDGRVVVGDRQNGRVQVFDADGKFLAQWRDTGAPYGLFVQQQRAFLVDMNGTLLRIHDLDGKRMGSATIDKGCHWVSVDKQGAVYLAFVAQKKVEKWVAK